jgi:dihydrofolate reductase
MKISLIVAASTNNVIGKNNELPWKLPNDMKFFKNTTWGMPVIMGRKTFESLNNKQPLPGRINIVLTKQKNWKAEGAIKTDSIKDALFVAKDAETNEIFFIGGAEIFKEILPKADRIYLTRVHSNLEGDVYFPAMDEKKWELKFRKDCHKDERHEYDYTFETWDKK